MLMHRPNRNFALPEVNPFIYGGFSFLVIILGVITIVNFFISEYKSMLEFFNGSPWIPAIVLLAILIIGNASRIVIMSKLVKGR